MKFRLLKSIKADPILRGEDTKEFYWLRPKIECDYCNGVGKHGFYSTTYEAHMDTVCSKCRGTGSLP